MRSVGVVFVLPVADQDLRLEQRVELFRRQQLIAQPRSKGLDEGILPWRSGLDVARARLRETTPVPQRIGGELGSVVAADERGRAAAPGDDVV